MYAVVLCSRNLNHALLSTRSFLCALYEVCVTHHYDVMLLIMVLLILATSRIFSKNCVRCLPWHPALLCWLLHHCCSTCHLLLQATLGLRMLTCWLCSIIDRIFLEVTEKIKSIRYDVFFSHKKYTKTKKWQTLLNYFGKPPKSLSGKKSPAGQACVTATKMQQQTNRRNSLQFISRTINTKAFEKLPGASRKRRGICRSNPNTCRRLRKVLEKTVFAT